MTASRVLRVLVTLHRGPDSQPIPMGQAEAARALAGHSYVLRAMRVYPRVGRVVEINPAMGFGVGGLVAWLTWAVDPEPDDKVMLITTTGAVFEAEAAEIRDVALSVQLA